MRVAESHLWHGTSVSNQKFSELPNVKVIFPGSEMSSLERGVLGREAQVRVILSWIVMAT